jgi:hypothetical protein
MMYYLIFLATFLIPDQALAYIDPGTGSVVFSALGYIIASAAAFLALFLRPIKHLLKKLFRRNGTTSIKGDESEHN